MSRILCVIDINALIYKALLSALQYKIITIIIKITRKKKK